MIFLIQKYIKLRCHDSSPVCKNTQKNAKFTQIKKFSITYLAHLQHLNLEWYHPLPLPHAFLANYLCMCLYKL